MSAPTPYYIKAKPGGRVPIGYILDGTFLGEIKAPDGWLLCDGSPIDAAKYPELTALLVDDFGGRLPDLRESATPCNLLRASIEPEHTDLLDIPAFLRRGND